MRNRPIPFVSEADKAFVRGLLTYEDVALLAFNKPSGLPVQSRGNKARCLDELLWAFARSNGKRPRLVHRLDAGTSGLIIAAKTQPAAASLSAAFEARQVEKRYLALVSGALPTEDTGIIDTPLLRLERDAVANRSARSVISDVSTKGARPAVTRWRVVVRSNQAALLEVQPETGRMHQIRAHLAHAGMPIIGDALYGGEMPADGRLMLHASSLEFPHPEGQRKTLKVPLQDDFITQAKAHEIQLPAPGDA